MSRTHNPVSTNNQPNNINSEFYYQPPLMMNNGALPPLSYTYFHPSNYLSKPIPLMSTTNPSNSPSNGLPPTTLFIPPELQPNVFYPPSSVRTNNQMTYPTGIKKKVTSESVTQPR